MNDATEFDQLDKLLANSAVIADRGFSQRVEKNLTSLLNTRRNLFLITGMLWLALMFIASSPQAIYADLSTLAASLDFTSIYAFALGQADYLSTSSQQLPFATMVLGLLAFVALGNAVIRT